MAYFPFTIKKYDNTVITPVTGYTLPYETFKFTTDFTGVEPSISDKKIVWNFGDGTTSHELSSNHSYTFPGNYTVTMTLFTSAGTSTPNLYTLDLNVRNYISDTILLTTTAAPILTSGQIATPIILTRWNSWQTSLTSQNCVINLAVSGNQTPFYSASAYNLDKWAHLKASSRFALSGTNGLTIVDSVTTTNDPIFVSLSGKNYFAGTSGHAMFYYIEDAKI